MSNIHKNKIAFYIGPSNSGKDTFFKKSLSLYEVLPIVLLTTRPPRPGEAEGREYYFKTKERMDFLDRNGELIERRDYNTMNGIWSYATGKESIDLEKYNYLTPNTWAAYKKFLEVYPKECLVPIYFQLDKGIRLQRALDREKESTNSDYAEMCRRFLADEQDFTNDMIDLYKPLIINNNGSIEETLEQIDDIMVRKLGILPKQN